MKKTAIVILFIFIAAAEAFAAGPRKIPDSPTYYDEVLVTYKQVFTADDISLFTSKHVTKATDRQSVVKEIETYYNLKKTRLYLPENPFVCYRISDITKMQETVDALKNESVILAAQPNYKRYALYTGTYGHYTLPNDPYYQAMQEWGFWQVRADKAFNSGLINMLPQRNVIVAVEDTGLLLEPSVHEDMAGLTVNGYNVITPSAKPNDDEFDPVFPTDPSGHGTHVSGVIAANTGNSKGIAGSAYCNTTWTAKVLIMPVKVLDWSGTGSDADIYTGVKWAVDNGANIINMSLGGAGGESVLQSAVNYAYVNGCVVVAAAGNNSAAVFYPAGFSTVISVSASDMVMDVNSNTQDTFADFSNFGKVEVSAPGVDILSCDNKGPADYSYMNGTSFSSPIVAGLAALLKLNNPSATPDEIRAMIINSSDDAGAPGFDRKFGWGRVNFFRALTADYNISTDSTLKTYNWPNPFSPDKDMQTTITFLPYASEDMTISIYDGGGDIVWKKEIPAASVKANIYNNVKWDGMNTSGIKAANGTYFYIVKARSGIYGKNKICVLY